MATRNPNRNQNPKINKMTLTNILLLAGAAILANQAGILNGAGVTYIYEVQAGGNIKKITGYPTGNRQEAIKLFKESNLFNPGKNYAAVKLEIFY